MFYSRLAVPFLLTALYAGAWPIFPPQIYANHAAYKTPKVAPGSFISIRRDPAGAFPADLSQTKIDLRTSDGGVYSLPAVEPPKESPDKDRHVWAVIPQGAALGAAVISLGTLDSDIQIVAAAPGLFTLNYLGFGTAIALDRSGTRLGLTHAAMPLEEISLWGTGLRSTPTSAITVHIGGVPAEVVFAGPHPLPGLDQVNVIIPNNAPRSCYVQVRVWVGGVESNPGSLPISENANECSHPLGLTYAERQTLDSGGSLVVSRLQLRGRYSATYADENASLLFSEMDASDVFLATSTQGADVGSCVAVGAVDEDSFPGSYALAATLQGPDGRQTVVGSGSNPVPKLDPFFQRGEWSLSAPPSSRFAAVQERFHVAAPLREFSPGIYITFTSGQDMVFTWDPAPYTKNEIMTVRVPAGNRGSECRVFADQGTLVFPSALFDDRKGKGVAVDLSVRPVTRPTFRLSGTDGSQIPVVIDAVFSAGVMGYIQ